MAKKKKRSEVVNGKFSAEPSKYFFIDMLTRDIPLEWAILDLIDNSVDGARNEIITKRKDFRSPKAYKGFYIHLKLNEKEFVIEDNCGGFTKKAASEYTFKFGRPKGENDFPKGSVGRFGVGMKRGMFKIGTYFIVETKNGKDHFIVEEDIVAYQSPEHFREMVDYYLAHPVESETIIERGRARVLRGHTYQQRLTIILETLRQV